MRSMDLAATVALLFFAFSVLHARDPFDLHQNQQDALSELPESNSKAVPTILLPGEKVGYESESNRVVDFEPAKENGIDLPTLPETDMEIAEPRNEEETDTKVPLTIVSFRPHFVRGSLIPLRRGRRCGHHHQFKRFEHRFRVPKISFGNDMILSKEVDTHSDSVEGDEFQIQPQFYSFDDAMEKSEDMMMPHHHHHPHVEEFKHEMDNREDMMMPRHHHHHRHHHGDEEMESEHEHEHKYNKGFMRKIHKFFVNLQA